MIEARNEIMHGSTPERPKLTDEEYQHVYEELDVWPPRVAHRNLARFRVQLALFDMTPTAHIRCAQETPKRWYTKLGEWAVSKYGDRQGFCLGDVENEAIISDQDDLIWDGHDG